MNNEKIKEDALRLCLDALIAKEVIGEYQLIAMQQAKDVLFYEESFTPYFLRDLNIILEIRPPGALFSVDSNLKRLQSVKFDYEKMQEWVDEQMAPVLTNKSNARKQYGLFEISENNDAILLNKTNLKFAQGRGPFNIMFQFMSNVSHELTRAEIQSILNSDKQYTGHATQNRIVNDAVENIRKRFVKISGKPEYRDLIVYDSTLTKYSLLEAI